MKVFLSAALLLSSMTLGAAGPAGADGVWRDPVDISPAARDGSSPQITSSADGKRLTSVWITRRAGRPGDGATPPAQAAPDLELPDMRSLADLLVG